MNQDSKAGKEVDALVAEKVMGLKPTKPLAYSTDIAVAWTIIPRMYALGFCVATESQPDASICVIGKGAYLSKDIAGPGATSATTMPLAICLAALKAIGA